MNTIQHAEWLTPREIASTLKVSRPTTYRLIASGELPAIRVGHQLRVATKDLDAYLHHGDTEGHA